MHRSRALALLLLAGCPSATPAAPRAPTAAADESLLDRTVDPCDDFYQYACGGWIARTAIPDGRSSFAIYESALAESAKVLRDIVEDAARGASKLAEARQIADFWTACTASDDPDAEAVLAEELARIDAARDRATLAAAVARVQLLGTGVGPWTLGTGALFAIGTDYDLHEPTLVTLQLDQGGTVLPAAAYRDESPEAVKLRATYRDHVGRMLALAGRANGGGADAVLRIETALARAAVGEQERRDPASIDHLTARDGLSAVMPHFDWDAYLAALGRADATAVNLVTPAFYRTLDGLLAGARPEDLRAYLAWHLLHELGPVLPARFAAERQVLEAALTGAAAPRDRAEDCLDALGGAMGDALGALYVERRFSPELRRAANELADRVVATFGADLDRVPWLDAPTRAAAKEKLGRVGRKIGAPEHARSFAALTVDRRSRARNQIAVALFNSGHWLRRAGTRPPRDEWLLTPQTFDAYYDVARNEMVFPAVLFQPPFFYAAGHLEENWANIGWVMGHELSHGFDSEGRKYDASGLPRSLWSASAEAAFQARAECVVAQYDAYEPLPGVHLDGRSELTENIADVGALRLAYEAYVAARGPRPPEADQAFFLAVAQGSCTKVSDERTRATAGDVHPPWRFRVNGPLADLPAFARAFHCPAGARMAPAKPCAVW
jgi:predicted metalloendopeptidase